MKIGDIVSGGHVRTRAIVMQQKLVGSFSLNCCRTLGPACWPGLNAGAAQWTIMFFRAGSIITANSAPGTLVMPTMLGGSMLVR